MHCLSRACLSLRVSAAWVSSSLRYNSQTISFLSRSFLPLPAKLHDSLCPELNLLLRFTAQTRATAVNFFHLCFHLTSSPPLGPVGIFPFYSLVFLDRVHQNFARLSNQYYFTYEILRRLNILHTHDRVMTPILTFPTTHQLSNYNTFRRVPLLNTTLTHSTASRLVPAECS